jgi:glucose-1-phosphate thymidylyltransferase
MAVVGVVPAAGQATRLQPLDRSKEVLELDGRPVLEYLVERLRAARADRIRVVTRPEKQDVVALAESLGAECVLARPEHVSASLLAGLEGLDADDLVLFGFPDTVWEPVDGFARLRELVEAGEDIVLGLFSGAELERSDVAVRDDAGRIVAIDVKPATPRSRWIWGCGAARASLLSGAGPDAEPGVYFDRLARKATIAAVELSDIFIDIGTPEALAALRSQGRV